MPKLPIDYSKSSIYRLVFNHETYYVGSTTNFSKRKGEHKRASKNEKNHCYNLPIYKFIRETGGWDAGWDMVLIENFPCASSPELRQRERFYFDEYRPTLKNTNKPYVSDKEFIDEVNKSYDDYPEKLLKYQEKYNMGVEEVKKKFIELAIKSREKIASERSLKVVKKKFKKCLDELDIRQQIS